MRWLDMMSAVSKHEKVRHKDWPEGKYLFLRDDGLLCVGYEDIENRSICNAVPFTYSNVINLLANDWLIYESPMLKNREKKYLEAVLTPFKDRVISIRKVHHTADDFEYIEIVLSNNPTSTCYDHDDTESLYLPWFEEGTRYERMRIDWPYSLKELQLFENKDFDF